MKIYKDGSRLLTQEEWNEVTEILEDHKKGIELFNQIKSVQNTDKTNSTSGGVANV